MTKFISDETAAGVVHDIVTGKSGGGDTFRPKPRAAVDSNNIVQGIVMVMYGDKPVSSILADALRKVDPRPDAVRLLPVPSKPFAGGPVGKGWTVREADNGTLEYSSPRDEETGTSTFRVLYREEHGVAVQMVPSWKDGENG